MIAATALTLLGPGDNASLATAGVAGLGGLWLALNAVGKLAAPPQTATSGSRRSKWRMPSELDQPTPRRVRLKPIGWVSAVLWLAVAALLVGLSEFGLPRRPDANLRGELATADASVASKSMGQTAAGAQPTLTLAFTTERGETIRARVPVTRLTFELAKEGDTYDALYLPGDASRYVFPGLRRPLDRRMKYALYAIGLALLLMLEWIRRRERSLVRHGTVASAEARGVKTRGASRSYEAVFEARGQTLKIPTTERSRTRTEGDLVTVLFHPEKPGRATVYETSFYQGRRRG